MPCGILEHKNDISGKSNEIQIVYNLVDNSILLMSIS